jgi:O-antigen/teichoic acid export membrane protein
MFATPEYYASALVVPLLVPAILLSGMYIFGPGLGIAKKTGVIALINIIGAVLNTSLNFTLIPLLGIRGAALATLLSSITVFAAYIIYSQNLYFIPHTWLRLAGALLLTIGVFFVGAQLHLTWWVNIIIKLVLIGFVASVLIWLDLVETAAIKRIWQRLGRLQAIAKA